MATTDGDKMALQLSFNVKDKCTTIIFSGDMNEFSSPLDYVVVDPSFDLDIDLRHLRGINSLGVRNFHSWVHKVKCVKLRFFYCPRSFINQLNLIDNLLPSKAEIESFFVPYYSEKSGEEVETLFTKYLEYKKVKGVMVLNQPEVLDSLGNKMDLDALPDRYFRFLSYYF